MVVRARIDVDPTTRTLTVTTDETGPYAVPQIVFGVPVAVAAGHGQHRSARLHVQPDQLRGAADHSDGLRHRRTRSRASRARSRSAAVKSLAFKPTFKVSHDGHTSRAVGASLDAKLSYPEGSRWAMRRTSRRSRSTCPSSCPRGLTTLQKACPAATFEANPAACPEGSIVGIVRAIHAAAAGRAGGPGVLRLPRRRSVPVADRRAAGRRRPGRPDRHDVHQQSRDHEQHVQDRPRRAGQHFELYLPQGKYSALAANGNLCKQQSKLKMPTEFVAQNGAVFKQSTKIAVTGCGGNAKSARRHAQQSRHNRGGRDNDRACYKSNPVVTGYERSGPLRMLERLRLRCLPRSSWKLTISRGSNSRTESL